MFFYFYISLIVALPKFTFIYADQISKNECKNINDYLTYDYFPNEIYERFPKDQAKELSDAFQGFLCTHKDFDIDDALSQVSSKTELLLIHAFDVDDEIDFGELKKQMVVHLLGCVDEDYSKLLSTEKGQYFGNKITNMARKMFSISYDVKSRSKNLELSTLLSNDAIHRKRLANQKAIEIDGEMKKKVSFLAVFDHYQLIFDSDLDCDYVYLYNCEFGEGDQFKIESQNLLVDPTTYESLYYKQASKQIKVSVNQFGIIMDKEETIRLTFSASDVWFGYSTRLFPTNPDQYRSLLNHNVPRNWFKTIAVLSSTTQYSLYLDDDFNPKKNTLPGINISINEPETQPLTFMAKENVEIKTESTDPDAWNQFSTKPSISVDCDSSKFNIEAPSNIQVSQTDHTKDNANKNKKKKIIIIVCVCVAAVIVIIVVVVVVVKCRNKYNNKVVYIADDQHNSAAAVASQLNTQSTNGFTDNMDDKKDEKELSDQDLEKENNDAYRISNNSNNQSHDSIATSQPSTPYAQADGPHPGFPPQVSPTGSANNLPTDQPTSNYTVPF